MYILRLISGADPGFQARGADLKKLRRAEGGAKNFELHSPSLSQHAFDLIIAPSVFFFEVCFQIIFNSQYVILNVLICIIFDDKFIENLQKLIQEKETLYNNENINPTLIWELIKSDIRGYAIK
jgi:hypothetical protein